MWDGAGFFSFFGLLCGILIPQPEIKPSLPAVEAQSLNHLTTREIPGTGSFDHTMVGNVTPETYKGWRDFWSSLPSPAPQSLSLVCLELKGIWNSMKILASLTGWTWVWVNSGSWWWTGRPGVLRFMGSQRVGRDWTELNWLSCCCQVKGIGVSTKASRWGYRCRIFLFKWKLRAMYIFMPTVLCFMPLQP